MLVLYRKAAPPAVRLRAHILLLLDDGYSGSTIAAMLCASPSAMSRWRSRILEGEKEAVCEERRVRSATFLVWWMGGLLPDHRKDAA